MILNPKNIGKTAIAPAAGANIVLLKKTGPGVFVSTHITKEGGSTHSSFLVFYIDGVVVWDKTFSGSENIGLDMENNSGIKMVNKNLSKTITIQFNEPLYFKSECRIEIITNNDTGIGQIVGNMIVGSNCKYPA